MRTREFYDVLGVFSGGGMRIPAFAGAYFEAYQRGVRFREVAGTSGGAIIAALIAAGTMPEQMRSMVTGASDLYAAIAVPPEPIAEVVPIKLNLLMRVLMRLAETSLRLQLDRKADADVLRVLPRGIAARVLERLGVFGNSGLQNWLNSKLREALVTAGLTENDERGEVTFKDLLIPLTIVAADITVGDYKIWSTERTPDASVARAVTASCSIPFVFQPVVRGPSVLVDGGVHSYFPAYVYSLAAASARATRPRILGFVFESPRMAKVAEPVEQPLNLLSFTRGLIASVVYGGSSVQEKLVSPVHTIRIDPGNVSAIEFDLNLETRERLFEIGRSAATDFFEQEADNVVKQRGIVWDPTVYKDSEEILYGTTSLLREASEEVLILGGDLSWIHRVWILLLHLGMIGKVKVRIICEEGAPDETLAFITDLGVDCLKVSGKHLDMKGTLIDPDEAGSAMIAVGKATVVSKERFGRIYRKPHDSAIIDSFRDFAEREWERQDGQLLKGHHPTLGTSPQALSKLQNVVQYRKATNEMYSLQIHDTPRVIFMARNVRARKANQMESLMEIYKKLEATPFEGLVLNGKNEWVFAPPILEVHREKLYLIDGASRLFHWRKYFPHTPEAIRVAVVRNCSSSLPAPGLNMLRVTEKVKVSTFERFLVDPNDSSGREMLLQNFRHIHKALGHVEPDPIRRVRSVARKTEPAKPAPSPRPPSLPSGDQIFAIATHGESEVYEFKAQEPEPRRMAKEIAAFLNTSTGGYILIGIGDDGTILGTNVSRQEFDQRVQNVVRHMIKPTPEVQVDAVLVQGKQVIIVSIPPWNKEDVYYFEGKGWIRRGTSAFPAEPDEMKRLYRGEVIM